MKRKAKRPIKVSAEWRAEGERTFVTIMQEMQRLIGRGQEIPLSLTSAAKTLGGMNVEAGALLGDGTEKEPKP